MSTLAPEAPPSPTSDQQGPGVLGSLAGLTNAFFFRPVDPTVLGVMRICTGLVVLYVHLVYSFDLQALCGKDAWLNLETANELRHDAPVMAFPTNWDVPGALQRATSPPTS